MGNWHSASASASSSGYSNPVDENTGTTIRRQRNQRPKDDKKLPRIVENLVRKHVHHILMTAYILYAHCSWKLLNRTTLMV